MADISRVSLLDMFSAVSLHYGNRVNGKGLGQEKRVDSALNLGHYT